MYDVYNPSIYNAFIKELRQKHNLTIRDFSKKIHYSIGLLSEIENDPDLLNNGKLSVLLTYYGYDIDYLYYFDQYLNQLFPQFVHGVLYIDDTLVEQTFKELTLYFENYQNCVLYKIFELCKFIYTLYWDNNYEGNIDELINDRIFYSSIPSSLCTIYIGRFFQIYRDFEQSFVYLCQALSKQTNDDNINGLLNFFLSTYYVHTKDIITSIKLCEQAVNYFSKAQNYRRLINTNITRGNQYLKIRDYDNAKRIIIQTLNSISDKDYIIEKITLYNNLAFCYMIANNFKEAVIYFEQIPIEYMKDIYYRDYMLCLCELEQYKEAKKQCDLGAAIASTDYYVYMFNLYQEYLNSLDLIKLNKGLIKALSVFKNEISTFEIEFLHSLIAYHYKKLNKYKSAMEYLEKLKELNY